MNVLGLVQLCQSAEPAAYTFGIERLASSGRLANADALSEAVTVLLREKIAPAEGIASGVAFRAARSGNYEQLTAVCQTMSSGRLPAEMSRESVYMGRRLWGVSRTWDWAAGMHQQLDDMAERTELHHAVAFGTLVSETTSSEVRAIATCLFNTARGIVLAAVRRIPLDEIAGQRVLSSVQPAIAQLAAVCAEKRTEDIAVPGGEIFPL